jgi:hypothetical protein
MLALGHGVEKDENLPKVGQPSHSPQLTSLSQKLNLSKIVADGGTIQKILQVGGGGQHSAIIAVIRAT